MSNIQFQITKPNESSGAWHVFFYSGDLIKEILITRMYLKFKAKVNVKNYPVVESWINDWIENEYLKDRKFEEIQNGLKINL